MMTNMQAGRRAGERGRPFEPASRREVRFGVVTETRVAGWPVCLLPDGAVVLFWLACDGVKPGDFAAAAGEVFLDDIPLL